MPHDSSFPCWQFQHANAAPNAHELAHSLGRRFRVERAPLGERGPEGQRWRIVPTHKPAPAKVGEPCS